MSEFISFSVTPATIYTNSLTPVVCIPSLSGKYSTDKVVWNFGDGTVIQSPTGTHVYELPGEYTITLSVFTSGSSGINSSFTTTITARNLIDDIILLGNNYTGSYNVNAGAIDPNIEPISIKRYNSWQSFNPLSGYTLSLYASGSRSNRLNIQSYLNDKWSHIKKTWFFYTLTQYDNLQYDFTPIDQIATSTDLIYYRDDNGTLSKCLSSAEGAVFVGTSGTAEFYYHDSTPKNFTSNESPVYGIISFNLNDFTDNIKGNLTNGFYPFALVNTKPYFITMKVRYTEATSLLFTSCGIPSLTISENKWINTPIPFFINLVNANNVISQSYSPLTATFTGTPLTGENIINVRLVNTQFRNISATFRQSISGLPLYIDSLTYGDFNSFESFGTAILSARAIVKDPLHYKRDIAYRFTPSRNSDLIRFSPTQYNNAVNGYSTNILPETYYSSITGISLVPDTLYGYNNTKVVTVFPYEDIVVVSDTLGNTLSTQSLDSAVVHNRLTNTVQTLDLSDLVDIFTNTLNQKTQPYRATFDSQKNIWVSLFRGGSAVRINNSTNIIDSIISIPDNRYYATSFYGVSGFSRYEFKDIDVDISDRIWVSRNNFLSGGFDILTEYNNLSASYNLGTFISGEIILTDRYGYGWGAGGYSVIRPTQGTFVTSVTGRKAGTNSFEFTFDNASITPSFTTSRILVISGFDNSAYSGEYVITTTNIGTNAVTAVPYTGNFTSALSSASGYGTVLVKPCDTLYYFNSSLSLLSAFNEFDHINSLYIDLNQNVWVADYYNRVTKIIPTSGIVATYYLSTDTAALDTFTGCISGLLQITGDLYNNIWISNLKDNRMWVIPQDTTNSLVSSIVTLSGSYASKQYLGDSTGISWINKFEYGLDSSNREIAGFITFNLQDKDDDYDVSKFNETVDMAEIIKSYRFQEFLLEYNTFFDDFLSTTVGDVSASVDTLGKRVYEKIANMPKNLNDVDVCNIAALLSICKQYNVPVFDYNYPIPPSLQRLIDLFSISHKRLLGQRSIYNRNFTKKNYDQTVYGRNLGDELSVETYIASAGVPIVAYDKFNRNYSLINTPYISAGSGSPGFIDNIGLSAYPLSGYSPLWGWNLDTDRIGLDIRNDYQFFIHVDSSSNIQLEGVIDWDSSQTTISPHVSTYEEWYDDGGIVENLINRQIYIGCDLL